MKEGLASLRTGWLPGPTLEPSRLELDHKFRHLTHFQQALWFILDTALTN